MDQQMKLVWDAITDCYGRSKELGAMMAKMSTKEGLTSSDIYSAWQEWMRQGKSTMPTFGDLLKIIRPESNTNARQLATQIASIIPQLISKHGYYWQDGCFGSDGNIYYLGANDYAYASFEEAVQSYLGDFAHVVTRDWKSICATWDDNPTTNFAQIRDRFESEIVSSNLETKRQAIKIAHQEKNTIAHEQKLLSGKEEE